MTSERALSAEAIAYRNSYEPELDPIDFSNIDQVRADAKSGFAAAVDRAIERHALEFDDVVVGGVDCLRIRSGRGGTANGSMLYIFGGGFIVGDPETDVPVSGAFADWCGVEVIAPRYRLAPEHQAPAASDDCLAVYTAMVDAGPERILLAGESAGGNLALLTAQRALAAGLAMPAALALLSPAVDLRTERELFGTVVDADPSLAHQLVLDIANVYPGDLELDDPTLSPLFGSLSGLPPTILTTGTRDLLMEMTLQLARSLRRAGVEVECNVWPGLWHVFEFYDQFPESAESLREIAAFAARR